MRLKYQPQPDGISPYDYMMTYDQEALETLGMTNDTISSIMVPEGYLVRLYRNDFSDYMGSILGSYLDDETQEMECISAPN